LNAETASRIIEIVERRRLVTGYVVRGGYLASHRGLNNRQYDLGRDY